MKTTNTPAIAPLSAKEPQRFNNRAGLMNPEAWGLYVRYEDHAALIAQARLAAQPVVVPTDAEIIDILWDAKEHGWKPDELPKATDRVGYFYKYGELIAAFRLLMSRPALAAPVAAQADTTASVSPAAPTVPIYQVRNGRGVWTDVDSEYYVQFGGKPYDRRIVYMTPWPAPVAAAAPVSQAVEQPADDVEDARAIQFALELAEHENDDAAISFLKAWNNEDAGYLRSNWPDFDAAMSATKQEDDK